MRVLLRGIGGFVFAGVILVGWVMPARGTVVADRFDVTVSGLPAVQTPVGDVHFFRGFTDPLTTNGGATGESVGVSDIPTGNGGAAFAAFLPAVQSPPNEDYSLVGFCDGSVVVALNFDSAKNFVGNAGFNFQTTFGISEADLVTALENGDASTINTFFVDASENGLLPAVQRGVASGGELVGFSTPVDFGSISVVENVPEAGTVGMVGAAAVGFLGRRRRGGAGGRS